MMDESTLKKLRALSSDLVMVGVTSSLEEWTGIARAAEDLAAGFLREGDSAAQDLANLLAEVATTLSKGIIANPEAGVKAIHNIISALQGLEDTDGILEPQRKQAQAEAALFFRDASKEEALVNQATTFDDEEEHREMIITIEQRITELESDLLALDPPVTDSEEVRAIFRQFHTLKGEGAICGIKSIAEFCHGIETEIEDARSGQLVLTHELVAILQDLTSVIRPILAGDSREEIGEDLIQSLMEELRIAVAKSKESGGVTVNEDDGKDKFADFFSGFEPPPAREMPGQAGPGKEYAAGQDLSAAGDGDAFNLAEELSASDFLDALLTEGSEVGQPQEMPAGLAVEPEAEAEPVPAGADTFSGDEASQSGEGTVVESGDLADDRPADLNLRTAAKKDGDTRVKAISIDVNRLDDLLESVGEVSILGSYIIAQLKGREGLARQATNLLRACSRLQEAANAMRMTSIRPLFMTVRRAAADAARACRKLIDINMSGIDTLVDRSIVESLSAALIHIIRNAVDHGIEPADVRRRAGKPERGSITISATRTHRDIVIELADDGRGFDLEALQGKAVSMGKIDSETVLSDEEQIELAFLSGLSTAGEITNLSGRGVGMEIIRESISSLRGKVEIRTVEGKGSTMRMRFPLQVAAMDAMLVRVGASILALPVGQVRECFRPAASDISTIEGRDTIVTIRGVILPVLFLGREFGIVEEAKSPEDGVLMVVETGEKLAAVLVDETLGTSQVVIRSLEGPLAQSDLVAGAAVLPDGGIGLVIETTRLTERAGTTASKAFNDAGKRQAENSRQVDTVSIGSNQVGMIDFSVIAPDGMGGVRSHIFAINAFKTREFVPVSELRSVPHSPPGFAGLMVLRDTTVPVVHMGVVLGLLSEQERRPEWEQIVLICEFAGRTVGFLVSAVERVSYISWEDIMPPPATGGLIQLEYIVGTILLSRLKDTQAGKSFAIGNTGLPGSEEDEANVVFVLDYERIVGNVMHLYGDMGTDLSDMGTERKVGGRILLVEDSPLIRKRTGKALAAAGITVLEAGDGQEAWEMIEEFRLEAESRKESIFTCVDLVLSDIEMPRMDGYTLTSNIKNDPFLRVLPVLLHSSITSDGMISRAKEVEADGFIPKCDPKELADQLRKYL